MNLGVSFSKGGNAKVRVWAPQADAVQLKTVHHEPLALHRENIGYWYTETEYLKPHDSYSLLINGRKSLPDPASLSQPEGVHGHSQALNLDNFDWTDGDWANPRLTDYIIYELHTGTFSVPGTFAGIAEKLDYLLDLGVTAIELMPVAQFAGGRNWGYDGVFPFAVQNSYGGAEELQRLVNACHDKGLAVVLDVVYNHLGPEGNYLPEYGPYFTEKYKTPWGNAINFDDAWCDGVREYFVENALMWFRDFHIDALRLDAVHSIKDFSTKHILQELRENVDALSALKGKTYHLIAECDLNDPRFINDMNSGGFGLDAQWIDEFHHALRVSAGQEQRGYYADFTGVCDLAKAYRDAYVYDGRYSEERHKTFGSKTNNAGDQFVVFSQNHDQVGNRMLGERSSQLLSFAMQKVMAMAIIAAPYLPMLFMGEEFSAPSPFQYFVSHTDKALIEAVRKGRKEEFKSFHAEGDPPDPEAEKTFADSKIPWDLLAEERHRVMLAYYRRLIALRKKERALQSNDRKNLEATANEENQTVLVKRWADGQKILCLFNFSKAEQKVSIPFDVTVWQKLVASSDTEWLGTEAVPAILSADHITLPAESAVIYTEYYV